MSLRRQPRGVRTGSILPDFDRIRDPGALPHDLQRGIRLHHQIDAFTDAHPIVRTSVRRIPAPFRRFGGILTDLWYDHFLARDWAQHSDIPLREFVDQAYGAINECRPHLSAVACERLDQMREADWLSSRCVV